MTSVPRTLFDLGRRRTDSTIARPRRRQQRSVVGLTSTSRARSRSLDRLARRGRPGTQQFRRCVGAASARTARSRRATQSTGSLRLLASDWAPARRFRSTRSVDTDGRLVARVDFAYPERKIAIEYDSYAHHLGTDAHDRDSARRNAIVALDWRPITATAERREERRASPRRSTSRSSTTHQLRRQRANSSPLPTHVRREQGATAGGAGGGGGWRCGGRRRP